jgi:hypothetical protein
VLATTTDKLEACAQHLCGRHPSGAPDADFITFGMATEFLRAVVDNEWTNQMVFGEHPTISRINRAGRGFMRAEATTDDERYRNQQRALLTAELLFNLQNVEGIDTRLDDLRSGLVESTYSELEAGGFLRDRGVLFRYVTPSGTKGADYDAEIPLAGGGKLNCEMKCKVESTDLSEAAVRNPLQTARKQLPPGEPGLVFLKIPEQWVRQPEVAQLVPPAIDSFLRGTSRVVAVVVCWEEQHLLPAGGALITYRFRLERGASPKEVPPAVEEVLKALVSPPIAPRVSFRSIAESVLVK